MARLVLRFGYIRARFFVIPVRSSTFPKQRSMSRSRRDAATAATVVRADLIRIAKAEDVRAASTETVRAEDVRVASTITAKEALIKIVRADSIIRAHPLIKREATNNVNA